MAKATLTGGLFHFTLVSHLYSDRAKASLPRIIRWTYWLHIDLNLWFWIRGAAI